MTGTTSFGFAGGYTTPAGLIYLINRYYNPQTGQFISVDPDLGQTLQPYQYANDNPVSNDDPTGLGFNALYRWIDWAWTGLGGVAWRTVEVFLDNYWTKQLIDSLNTAAAGGAGCAAGAAFIPWVDASVGLICGLFSGEAWLASAFINQVNDAGRDHGVYFVTYSWAFAVRWWFFGWHRKHGSWHFGGGYVGRQ